MSISSLQSQIERLQREIGNLQDKLSNATKKESDALGKVAQVQRGLSGRISASQLQSKLRDLARYQNEAAKAQKEQADLNKKLADKTRDLHKQKADLVKEEARERKKLQELDKQRQNDLGQYSRDLDQQLAIQRTQLRTLSHSLVAEEAVEPAKQFDLFISHASEDKDEFVRPLADTLQTLGVAVWYDEFQLRVGDSLRRSIDKGLANSRFGVVILSSAFFAKNWPQYELDGMVARETQGVKVILPIWHRVTKDEVMKFSPTLADRVALNSSINSIQEMANKLAEVALETKNK
jgi:hypothetical protein